MVVKVSSRHSRRLLAFLSVHRKQAISRARVASALFPDVTDARARRLLSQTLWRTRNLLGEKVVLADYDTLSLSPQVWSDVAAFEELAHSGDAHDWERAAHLYQGNFCPDCYDDWALLARERMRAEYLALLRRLIEHHKRDNDYEEALRYALECVRLEPLREETHREVIHLYLIMERPIEALKQCRALYTLLQEELGVKPSAELQALYRTIQARVQHSQDPSFAPLFTVEGRVPFVGRHKEREQLLAAVERAQRGYGGLVLVEGTPGMGKSRLLHEAEEGARWRGMLVGYGQAVAHRAGLYSPLQEAVERVLTPVCVATLRRSLPEGVITAAAHIWPALGSPAPNVRGRHIRNAAVQVLLALARCAPVFLLLDDVQNADADMFDLLEDLFPHVHHLPLLITLAFRPLEMRAREDLWQRLLALDRKAGPLRIALSGLSEEEKHLLIGAALGVQPDTPLVQTLGQASANVPLYIMEALRYLHRQGILRRASSGTWELTETDLPIPPSVPSLVQARLWRLPHRLREALEFLSILGERCPLSLAMQMIGEQAPQVLNDLSRYGFLMVEEAECRFVHVLVQEAIYETIPEERRRLYHREVAELLRRQTSPPWDQVAFHLQSAGLAVQAVQAYYRAARHAMSVFASSQALRYCDAALTLVDTPDPAVCDLWLIRGEAHTLGGDLAQARRDIARAIHIARCLNDNLRLARAYLNAGKTSIRSGRYRSARHFLDRAYDLYHRVQDVSGMAEVYVTLADVAETAGNLQEAQEHINRAMNLVQEHDLPETRLKVLARGGMVAARLGNLTEAERLYRQGAELAQQLGDPYVRGACLNGLGLLYLEQRRHRQAEVTFQHVLDIAVQIADKHNQSVTKLNLAVAAANAGRFATAYRIGQEALEIINVEDNWRTTILTFLLLGYVETVWGNFDRALHHISEARTRAGEKGFLAAEGFAMRNLGILAREQGEVNEAIRWGEDALTFFSRHLMYEKIPTTAYALGGTLIIAGEYNRARKVIQQGLDLAPSSPAMRAFLTSALLCAQRYTREQTPNGEDLVACAHALSQVEADEHLPRAWYHLYLAAEEHDPALAADALRRAYLALQAQCLEVPEEHHHAFLHHVLSHRLITQTWLSTRPRPVERLRLRLPRKEGKGYVMVLWTVDAGDEDALIEAQYGPIALRRHRLKRLLQEAERQGARATHEALAQALGVSVPTVRRDLRTISPAEDNLPQTS